MGEYVKWYPRFHPEEDGKLRKLKTDMEKTLGRSLTDRQFILLKDSPIAAPPIKMGPSRSMSHDVRAENTGTDHHTVQGLDAEADRQRLQAKMIRKKRGF